MEVSFFHLISDYVFFRSHISVFTIRKPPRNILTRFLKYQQLTQPFNKTRIPKVNTIQRCPCLNMYVKFPIQRRYYFPNIHNF